MIESTPFSIMSPMRSTESPKDSGTISVFAAKPRKPARDVLVGDDLAVGVLLGDRVLLQHGVQGLFLAVALAR